MIHPGQMSPPSGRFLMAIGFLRQPNLNLLLIIWLSYKDKRLIFIHVPFREVWKKTSTLM
jgi:hypothetical protein